MANLIRLAERVFLILLSLSVIARLAPAFVTHPQVAIFLASELVAVVLLLIQRRGEWTVEPRPVLIAFIGTGVALLVVPEGVTIASNAVSSTLILTGGAIALAAKLSIGRSFGVVPANRGVKRGGTYRLIRHPMYAGYILNHLGFLLLYLSWWNVAVYVVAWAFLWLRIGEEEKFLRRDPDYVEYAAAVPYRLIPGIA